MKSLFFVNAFFFFSLSLSNIYIYLYVYIYIYVILYTDLHFVKDSSSVFIVYSTR